ncbi:MAG: hypothetical protein ABR923_09760 [Terracidiphilus sp.]
MMVVVMVCSCRHLRLRHDRSREAEDEEESDQKPFHACMDVIPPELDYATVSVMIFFQEIHFLGGGLRSLQF